MESPAVLQRGLGPNYPWGIGCIVGLLWGFCFEVERVTLQS
jgi:hypothetical protein